MEFKMIDINATTFDRYGEQSKIRKEADEWLAERVNVFMEDGWRRDGPVQVMEYSSDRVHFVQMMVRG